MELKDIPHLDRWISQAFEEDLGDGDHSALSCIPPDHIGKAHLLVKENGVLAGVELAERILKMADPDVSVSAQLDDGVRVRPGDIAFVAEGRTVKLLAAERLLLNYMQRLSGIATKTRYFVHLVEGTGVKLLDTRKTTPGLRHLEKWAVRQGGGYNHRMGLYDMIMLKDNHIDFAGGIRRAVDKARNYLREREMNIPLEVEVRNMDEVREALDCEGVDRIMLDNFTVDQTRLAVGEIKGKCETESSGGINERSIRSYAETGVDYISVGALTHSAVGLDLSFKAL